MKLKAAIKYGEEDLVSAKVLMENSPEDDPDTEVNHGCLLYKVNTTIKIVTKLISKSGIKVHFHYEHFDIKQKCWKSVQELRMGSV